MEPRIERLDAFAVMGTLTRVDYGRHPSFSALWDRFMAHHDLVKAFCTEEAYYGVSYATDRREVVDYLAGMPIAPSAEPLTLQPAAADAPPIVVREVPAAQWAVVEFEFADMIDGIERLLSTWLPASEYILDMEVPISDFLRFGDGPVRFHVPVCRAE